MKLYCVFLLCSCWLLLFILSSCSGGANKYDNLVGEGDKRWYYRERGTASLAGTATAKKISEAKVNLKEQAACIQDDAWIFGANGRMSYWYGSLACDDEELQNKTQHSWTKWRFIADSTKIQMDHPDGSTDIWQIKRLTNKKLHLRIEYSSDGGDSVQILERRFDHGL